MRRRALRAFAHAAAIGRRPDRLNASLRLIEETLRAGGEVTLPGFGTFSTARHQAGMVRHIRTGEPVAVSARTVAAFRVGDILKRAVNGQRQDAGRKTTKAT